MVKVKVKTYIRKGRRVKGHIRKHRGLGKKTKFKRIGTYYVAYDELGNLRGSKVIPYVKKKKKR